MSRCKDPRCQLRLGHAGTHFARHDGPQPYTDEWGDLLGETTATHSPVPVQAVRMPTPTKPTPSPDRTDPQPPITYPRDDGKAPKTPSEPRE